jgi:hypothetical protein
MPKCVVISHHPPNSCPSANAVLRKKGKSLGADLPPLMQKHSIKPEVMLHLDPGHRVLWVLDAPNAEAVRDAIYERGLAQWNDFEFYMASTLEWVTDKVRDLPTIW